MPKQNDPSWPVYTGHADEWTAYALPNMMPRFNAPEDVPLPFDRSRNLNFKNLLGNNKDASDRVHDARHFLGGRAQEQIETAIHWSATMEIVMGQPPATFNRAWQDLQQLTGPRPHPLSGKIISNSTKRLLNGDGYAKMVFNAVWERHWWPIIEITAWNESGLLYHRLIPSRHLYSGTGMERPGARSLTYQIIERQVHDISFK